jgi:4-hydroxymandelate synthase
VLRTDDVRGDWASAVAGGAVPVSGPVRWPGGEVTATIGSFGDLRHTLIQRPTGAHGLPTRPGLPDLVDPADSWSDRSPAAERRPGLLDIDHFAVCLETGTLSSTVAFYESVLNFQVIFEERIVVGAQAMLSQVVQSASGAVTLTLIQPDPDAEAGQIDDFLKEHAGPGIQHIAFGSAGIVDTIGTLCTNGVQFLHTPPAYYRLLTERLELTRYTAEELKRYDILVDSDHDGQLFQIFARSVHPRRTFFFEVIERFGARTFGSGNIKALYEAVEAERIRSQDLV